MQFTLSITITILLQLLPVALSNPTAQDEPDPSPLVLPTWTVHGFQAYTGPNLSYASFVVTSTPAFSDYANRLCGISSNASIYDSIYESKMTLCEGIPPMWFQITEAEVVLRSTWKTDT
jgi:hypothetical protein